MILDNLQPGQQVTADLFPADFLDRAWALFRDESESIAERVQVAVDLGYYYSLVTHKQEEASGYFEAAVVLARMSEDSLLIVRALRCLLQAQLQMMRLSIQSAGQTFRGNGTINYLLDQFGIPVPADDSPERIQAFLAAGRLFLDTNLTQIFLLLALKPTGLCDKEIRRHVNGLDAMCTVILGHLDQASERQISLSDTLVRELLSLMGVVRGLQRSVS